MPNKTLFGNYTKASGDRLIRDKNAAESRARAANSQLAQLRAQNAQLESEKAEARRQTQAVNDASRRAASAERRARNAATQAKNDLLEIMNKTTKDQAAALRELERKSDDARKEQQRKFDEEQKKRKEEADKKLAQMKTEMNEKHEEQQKLMEKKMNDLEEANEEERQKLMAQMEEDKQKHSEDLSKLEQSMAEKDKKHAEKMEELQKIVEKKNYESHYPIPESLKLHNQDNPKSFNLQILGCRGAGKSTFVNKFLKAAKLPKKAATGTSETTVVTAFYNITEKVSDKPERYNDIFICDQPGIGGLQITEAGYLAKFGPGHFNFTLMLGEKGFNEMDMSLLKHLIHNNKPLAFVRTQCDSAINGIQDEYADENDEILEFSDALAKLQDTFGKYIKHHVLTQTNLEDLDFARLTEKVLSGELLNKIAKEEPSEEAYLDAECSDSNSED